MSEEREGRGEDEAHQHSGFQRLSLLGSDLNGQCLLEEDGLFPGQDLLLSRCISDTHRPLTHATFCNVCFATFKPMYIISTCPSFRYGNDTECVAWGMSEIPQT